MEIIVTGFSVLIVVAIFVWVIFILIGEISAVTYVPTEQKEIKQVLEKFKFKQGKTLIDLGSGDGRIVRTAVEEFRVKGIGYEIHPLLVWYAKFRSKNNPNIEFKHQSLWQADLAKADYIFCYLSPWAMNKLTPKIQKECKPGVIIISKAFEAKLMKKSLKEIFEINNRRYFNYQN